MKPSARPILISHVRYFERLRVRLKAEQSCSVNYRAHLSSSVMTMLDYVGVENLPGPRSDDLSKWTTLGPVECDWPVAWAWVEQAESRIAAAVAAAIRSNR